MKRLLVLAATLMGVFAVFAAQPVKADETSPQQNAGLNTWTNQLLGALPAPPSWKPRHACVIVDEINWGECLTFPWPS
jgi:hypothetical protein